MKKIIAFIAMFTILFQLAAVPAFAHSAAETNEPTTVEMNEPTTYSNAATTLTPRRAYTFCSSCGSQAYLRCAYVKLGVAGSYGGSKVHNSCTISYYSSQAVYICSKSSCGKRSYTGIWHDCYTKHSSCGKGTQLECTLTLSGL